MSQFALSQASSDFIVPPIDTTARSAQPKRLPPLTLMYWLLIISANTIGETLGDLISMPPINLGYALSTVILMGLFIVAVIAAVWTKAQHQWLYWTVVI